MNGKFVEINVENNANVNIVGFETNTRNCGEDSDTRIGSNEVMADMEAIEQTDGICIGNPSKPKSRSKSRSMSSKTSIKSNSSEDNPSVRSVGSNRSGSTYRHSRSVVVTKDRNCWDCHKLNPDYSCVTCLRSYHRKCPSLKKSTNESEDREQSSCPECIDIMRAEEGTNPSGCMQWLNGNVVQLSQLLEYTIVTVKAADRNHSFLEPVSTQDYPDYFDRIVNPMDLNLVERNILNKTYASTNSFLADIKWIYHNCVVFNSGVNNALISEAKNIIRVAKQECEEIEICPDCYYSYYTLEEDTYFAAVCRKPHAIVWAKLKGHPYWPAKVVRYNDVRKEVDVRFFGTHDKCWLRPEKCYLMSQNYPYNKKPSKFDQNKFDEAIRDMNSHLDELDKQFKGLFEFHEKHTMFTIDKLYLSQTKSTISFESVDSIDSSAIDEENETKKVLNTYNGIAFKNLKVNAFSSKFDIRNHLSERIDSSDHKSPPNKRFKRSPLKGSPKDKTNRCFSKSVPIRQELNSSADSNIESDLSTYESKKDNEIQRPVKSSNTLDSIQTNGLDENNLEINDSTSNRNGNDGQGSNLNSESTSNPILNVSGKSSKVLEINKTVGFDSNHNTTNGSISSDSDVSKPTKSLNSSPKSKPKSQKSKSDSNDESLRIKKLEFKVRQLEEELNESKRSVSVLEDEKQELVNSNEELKSRLSETKRKQWCTHCMEEAILPCCWNTCYCSVECQHQHWPVHSRSCRRRQQTPNKT